MPDPAPSVPAALAPGDAEARRLAYGRAEAEYGWAREGIIKYDEHLFRVRSWNMTLTIAIVGGYLGLKNEHVSAADAMFVAIVSCCTFWLLDAMNKSLQMVQIYVCRDLEKFMRSDCAEPLLSPTISVRFAKKQGHHLRPAVKNLTDESVWPFYLLPIAMSSTAIVLHSAGAAGCSVQGMVGVLGAAISYVLLPGVAPHALLAGLARLGDCRPAPDFAVAVIALLIPVGLVLLSRAWEADAASRPHLRYAFSRSRQRKHALRKELVRTLADLVGDRSLRERPRRLWAYKADFVNHVDRDGTSDAFAFFVDSDRRSRDRAYIAERTRNMHGLGRSVFVYHAGRLAYSPLPGLLDRPASHGRICALFDLQRRDEVPGSIAIW